MQPCLSGIAEQIKDKVTGLINYFLCNDNDNTEILLDAVE